MSAAILEDVATKVELPLSDDNVKSIREELSAGPSERELEVFDAVVREGRSQRETAAEFSLTQPRVCKILQEVEAWSERLTLDKNELSRDDRRKVAEARYRSRLDFFYEQAMGSWRLSKGEQEQTRVTRTNCGAPDLVTLKHYSQGKPTYLLLAMRIAEKLAKLDGVNTTGIEPRSKNRLSLHAAVPTPNSTAAPQAPVTPEVTPTFHTTGPRDGNGRRTIKQVITRRRPANSDKPLSDSELSATFDKMFEELTAQTS